MDYLKPLFNRRLLADALRELPPVLDDAQRTIALNWAASAARGRLLGQQEKPLQGQLISGPTCMFIFTSAGWKLAPAGKLRGCLKTPLSLSSQCASMTRFRPPAFAS